MIIHKKTISFELLLISTWFLGVMAIKFLLPSLPNIAEQLHTSPTLAKYTISIFLAGKATGMLAFGPMSEKYGRKIFMLIGLALFCLGNVLACFASSIEILLFARLVQGFGVSATVMIGRAMINDTYKNNKAAVVFSYIFLVASIIITLLPMLGSFIASHYQWRMTFVIMAAYSSLIFVLCYFLLDETHHQKTNITLNLKNIFHYYKDITKNPIFLGYALCSIFMIGGESAFNTASSFLLIKGFGISKNIFGILITLLAIGHFLGTLLCGKLVKHFDLVKMMGVGVSIIATSAILLMLLINLGFISVATIIVPMILFYIGTGFIMTITAVGVITPFPKLIATSSAAALSLNFSLSALASIIMCHLSTQTPTPVSILIAVCGISAFLSWYLLILPNQNRPNVLSHDEKALVT